MSSKPDEVFLLNNHVRFVHSHEKVKLEKTLPICQEIKIQGAISMVLWMFAVSHLDAEAHFEEKHMEEIRSVL